MSEEVRKMIEQFVIHGQVEEIEPLGNGLINDTYKVTTKEPDQPDYVLQRINHSVFPDVGLLQDNIEKVTRHIRRKLESAHVSDIDRKVLRFLRAKNGKTYIRTSDGRYWRMMVFIPRSRTYESVTPESSCEAGRAFGNFESMLVDLPEQLGETIPEFHNMELRARQLEEAVSSDNVYRVKTVRPVINRLEEDMTEMCKAERLFREGRLPKRICHCDTKVNNMLFDENGNVLCVIDLDTVMPSFVFSDYGDFLRTGANFVAEDDPHIDRVGFNEAIFKSFTKGYLEGTASFLTRIERDLLPYAVALFPFMQCTRFLTDYLNGDTYYKIQYPEHNLVRARNQLALYESVLRHGKMMSAFISSL